MIFYLSISVFSFSLALCIIFFTDYLFKLTDYNLTATQAAHVRPTVRFGGISILITSVIFSYLLSGFIEWQLLTAVLPLFLIGLGEDVGLNSSPKVRLSVAALCAGLGIFLYRAWLSNIDTPPLDWFLSFPIIGIVFTIFAIVGLVNAINLIDGINGLACGQVIISSVAISVIATKVGESNISDLALIIAFATIGLFSINYPFGRIFLGDAGAYTLGFVLAWLIVLLSHKHPEVSDWSLLAIVFWPVADTIFTIVRRKITLSSPGRPDRLHFHQIIMRSIRILSQNRISREMANPLATALILPFATVPVVGGAMFCFNSTVGLSIVLLSGVCFVLSYLLLITLARRRK